MKSILNVSAALIVCGVMLCLAGCDAKIAGYPHLQLISSRTESHLFADADMYNTFRNEGAGGKTLLTLSQNGRQWKRILYFDAGEQREVHYTLPGSDEGQVQMTWKPADDATPAELDGALAEGS